MGVQRSDVVVISSKAVAEQSQQCSVKYVTNLRWFGLLMTFWVGLERRQHIFKNPLKSKFWLCERHSCHLCCSAELVLMALIAKHLLLQRCWISSIPTVTSMFYF